MASSRMNYEVGYGKPPEHTKFKPGSSGNPRGRPKGSRGITAILDRAVQEKVVINEGGRRKTVTKFEAAMKQLANKAASGDLRASKLLISVLRMVEEQSPSPAEPSKTSKESDEKVLQSVMKRFNRVSEGETK
jgi:hypothetical protein